MGARRWLTMAVLLLWGAAQEARGAVDLTKCEAQLTKLLPCLPYVQGKAAVPAAGCCTNLQTVHEAAPECLCELIVSSVSGSGSAAGAIPDVNTTLALQLAPACNVKTQPSRCPSLLGIDPSSDQAKIFQTGAATTPAPADGPSGSTLPGQSSSQPPESAAPSSSPSHLLLLLLAFVACSCLRLP